MSFKFEPGERVRRVLGTEHDYYAPKIKANDEGTVCLEYNTSGKRGGGEGKNGEYVFVKWDNNGQDIQSGFYSCCLEAVDNAEQFKPEDWS